MNQEIGKCTFCGELKSVSRFYVNVKNKHFDDNIKGRYSNYFPYCNDCGIETDKPSPCPLTKSSHEKALVRVVEKRIIEDTPERACNFRADFIQVLCACGKTLSENEVTPLTRT